MSNKSLMDQELQTHLSFLQGIISRMGANSANAKTCCVTLIAGLLAFAVGKSDKLTVLLGLSYFPVIVFCFLDMYYLHLEKYFIEEYTKARSTGASNSFPEENLFAITGLKEFGFKKFLATFKSYSIWPFYSFLAVALAVIIVVVK